MKKTIIIAEAGVNHNGSIDIAIELVRAAAQAGADYVKFQTFTSEKIVSPLAPKAKYQLTDDLDNNRTQMSMLKKLELSKKDHERIYQACEELGIRFLSTAFDEEAIYYLNNLNIDFFKIPSGEITNYPYLRTIAKQGKPVVLSTGMADMDEVQNALSILEEFGCHKNNITILHCNTEYPTPFEDVNLKAMVAIKDFFDINVGYSDHTLGIEVPIAAVTLGASLIEKHFTLDRNLPGPDHKASLTPEELSQMIKSIRHIELALSGNGRKEPSNSEYKNRTVARRSIHLTNNCEAGHILKEQDLIPLRPGDGISPLYWNEVIGKKILRNLPAFHKLSWEELA